MPGTGTYTQTEVDNLIDGLQKQIDIRSTRAEMSVQGTQHNTKIQTNINDLTTTKTEVSNIQANISSLNRRLLATQTYSTFSSKTGEATYGLMQPFAASTVVQLSLYIDAGNAVVQTYNNSSGMFSTPVTGVAGVWATATPDSGAGFTTADSLTYAVLGNTGASDVRVQIDFTV